MGFKKRNDPGLEMGGNHLFSSKYFLMSSESCLYFVYYLCSFLGNMNLSYENYITAKRRMKLDEALPPPSLCLHRFFFVFRCADLKLGWSNPQG